MVAMLVALATRVAIRTRVNSPADQCAMTPMMSVVNHVDLRRRQKSVDLLWMRPVIRKRLVLEIRQLVRPTLPRQTDNHVETGYNVLPGLVPREIYNVKKRLIRAVRLVTRVPVC